MQDAWRANLEFRTAVRVLRRLERFSARDSDQLHAGARLIPWEHFLRPEGSLVVSAQTKESRLDHSLFVEQRVKDAVVDRFRSAGLERPSVDRKSPDLAIHVHLYRNRATISLDTSGAALHKRGWRLHQGRAPLAETLAAAVVLYSEWDHRAPLLDPFCGSGTIPIEAARLAARMPPASQRAFGFERWLTHQPERYRAWRARLATPPPSAKRALIRGSDAEPRCIEESRANAERAGVEMATRFSVAEARELTLRPGWNAWIVGNLPYGRRISADPRGSGEGSLRTRRAAPDSSLDPKLLELHRDFGARLRREGRGSRVALITGAPALTEALGLDHFQRLPFENGGLRCELVLGRL